jgi:hypothetical protein
MKIAVLAGAVAAALTVSTAHAAVRIKADPGGQIGPYLENLVALRGSGERVIIDGPCLSACTMLLGVIPRNRICVTPRARLGFHAAWHPGSNGQQVTSHEATQLLMDIYPEHVRSWIAPRRALPAHDVSQRPRTHGDVSDLRLIPSPAFGLWRGAPSVSRWAASANTPPAAAVSAMAP